MSADVSVDKSVGASVDGSVGDRGLPWYAVGADVEMWRLPWILPWILPSRLPWLVPWTFMVFRYLPRRSVEARAMFVEARAMSVDARGRPAVARGVSAVVRGTPWTWLWNAVGIRGHCRDAPPKNK